AARLTPQSSKHPKRPPCERDTLLKLLTYLDLESSQDAAIYACIVVTFYSISRLGKFTVPSLNKFVTSPSQYISHTYFSIQQDAKGLPVLSFHIPVTKCTPKGEKAYCALLEHLTDPAKWLDNHFCINHPNLSDHLFAWRHAKGIRPLMKLEVTKHIQEVVMHHDLPNIKGHSFCIGGTLHYLLLGTPFSVVKMMGWWSGESFTLYLHKHIVILAPYL
ncbi:hypothetical protein ID866_12185, partial [Astraeus odoratus]